MDAPSSPKPSCRPKVWLPDGAISGTEEALGLSSTGPATAISMDLYRDLLAAKFDALIRGDPKAAHIAMEASVEIAQDFYSIAQQYSVRDWGIQLVMCDQLQRYLQPLTGTGRIVTRRRKQSFAEIIDLLDAI